ncbi:MAG: Ig-like domain-containing protein [Granulosicoccus sp.]
MNKIAILLLAGSLTLTACGSRTSGTDTGNAQTTYGANGQQTGGEPGIGAAIGAVLSVTVETDTNLLSTGSAEVAVITAVVTDDSNSAVAGQSVAFSSTGGILQDVVTTTNDKGEATAALRIPQDYRNQGIVVTVLADTFVGSITIDADGSALAVSGPSSVVPGTDTELAVTLTDGTGSPIRNESINISSAAGNAITPNIAVTNNDGVVQTVIGSAKGSDTISFVALGNTASTEYQIQVSEDILTFATGTEGKEYSVGAIGEVEVTWMSQGQPVGNKDLRFSITSGEIFGNSVVRTNAAGKASITFSSGSAAPATISVADAADSDPQADVSVEFIATVPGDLVLEPASTRIKTGETSKMTAIVTDANGNPVKGIEVVFSSPDLKGGSLNSSSAVSDRDGKASVDFTAGNLATVDRAISIFAEIEGWVAETALTIVEQRLNVTIGSSNKVQVNDTQTQYSINFVVQVADGSGAPLADTPVELSIKPLAYKKGYYTVALDQDDKPYWAKIFTDCASEDINGNRVLDDGEDNNNNGELDPQDPASLAPIAGIQATLESGGVVRTDETGSGYFRVLYPVTNATWAEVEVIARAQSFGTESEDSIKTGLNVLASEFKDTNVTPANIVSPYGIDLDCTNED